MSSERAISRRHALTALAGLVLYGANFATARGEALRRTPGEILGPFYPMMKPLDQDADLTMVDGKTGRAQGQIVHLSGRVLNLKGEPVPGARIEIWQANAWGRYDHPSDTNPSPLDPNFQGYAVQLTDADGRYRFKTIKPGAYPARADWMRPPHIHFDVTGKANRLVTQMYFPGEPLNEKDLLLQGLRSNKEGAIANLLPRTEAVERDALIAIWDIVLDKG